MAVSVPGLNAQITPSTATCPPKRMVRSRVSSGNAASAIRAFSAECENDLDRRSGSTLVADRDRQLRDRDLADEVEQIILVLAARLQPELVHDLLGLMVLLAKDHPALGGIELHAL